MGRSSVAFEVTKEKTGRRPICPYVVFGQVTLIEQGCLRMDKQQLIDDICQINTTAKPAFLAKFSEADLAAYLEHLMELDQEEVAVGSS
jgi:hypothetical protein